MFKKISKELRIVIASGFTKATRRFRDAHSLREQRDWDALNIAQIKIRLFQEATSKTEKSRLLAAFSQYSGVWLNSIPIASMGLKLDNCHLRIAVATGIGAPVCRPHICEQCGGEVQCR